MDVILIWSDLYFFISHVKENQAAFVILWALKLKIKSFSTVSLWQMQDISEVPVFQQFWKQYTHFSGLSTFPFKTSQSIAPQASKWDNMWRTMRADFVNLHNRYNNSFSLAPAYVISFKVANLTMEFLDIPYRNINNCSFIHSQRHFSLFQIHNLTPFCFCRGRPTVVLKQSNVRCSRLSDNTL